jgi:hypothetical protein
MRAYQWLFQGLGVDFDVYEVSWQCHVNRTTLSIGKKKKTHQPRTSPWDGDHTHLGESDAKHSINLVGQPPTRFQQPECGDDVGGHVREGVEIAVTECVVEKSLSALSTALIHVRYPFSLSQ